MEPITIVKALSVIQPWASALFVRLPNGERLKGIETRSWKLSDKTEYPLRIAIHASKGFPKYAQEFAEKEQALGRIPEQLPFGAIIGFVSIIGMRRTEDLAPQISALESLYGNYSPERWGWMTCDAEQLPDDKIVPCKGSRGLWNVPADLGLKSNGVVNQINDRCQKWDCKEMGKGGCYRTGECSYRAESDKEA